MVLEEYGRVPTLVLLAYADGYMTWFYSVSHPIIIPDTPRRSYMAVNQTVVKARMTTTRTCRRSVDMIWRWVEQP